MNANGIPFTRSLAYVLREKMDQAGGVTAIAGRVVAVPDVARVRVDFGFGDVVTIPRLSGYRPHVADSVWCLKGPSFVLAIGAIGAGEWDYGTGLPLAARDGQIFTYANDWWSPVTQYTWQFRYSQAQQDYSGFGWQFVGGADWYNADGVGRYDALAPGWQIGSPGFTLPLSGIYDWQIGAQFTGLAGATFGLGLAGGEALGVSANDSNWATNGHQPTVVSGRTTPLAAGFQLWPNYYSSFDSSAVANRWMRVRPVAVRSW